MGWCESKMKPICRDENLDLARHVLGPLSVSGGRLCNTKVRCVTQSLFSICEEITGSFSYLDEDTGDQQGFWAL